MPIRSNGDPNIGITREFIRSSLMLTGLGAVGLSGLMTGQQADARTAPTPAYAAPEVVAPSALDIPTVAGQISHDTKAESEYIAPNKVELTPMQKRLNRQVRTLATGLGNQALSQDLFEAPDKPTPGGYEKRIIRNPTDTYIYFGVNPTKEEFDYRVIFSAPNKNNRPNLSRLSSAEVTSRDPLFGSEQKLQAVRNYRDGTWSIYLELTPQENRPTTMVRESIIPNQNTVRVDQAGLRAFNDLARQTMRDAVKGNIPTVSDIPLALQRGIIDEENLGPNELKNTIPDKTNTSGIHSENDNIERTKSDLGPEGYKTNARLQKLAERLMSSSYKYHTGGQGIIKTRFSGARGLRQIEYLAGGDGNSVYTVSIESVNPKRPAVGGNIEKFTLKNAYVSLSLSQNHKDTELTFSGTYHNTPNDQNPVSVFASVEPEAITNELKMTPAMAVAIENQMKRFIFDAQHGKAPSRQRVLFSPKK